MGKDKKKKKVSGMEKTLAKTEKKIDKAIKKELEEIGEESIEKLIADFNAKEKELNKVREDVLPVGECPSRRGGSTFNLNPEKDELILFGGEYYNGNKVTMFNDLFFYNIKKNQWTRVKAPNGPAPRTFHQSAFVSRNGGELWVFGGEFSSPTQSQFYHYNDLWCFQAASKTWKQVKVANGPSARSGHRMAVVLKKYLIVFGGYYDNLRNCRFYNDTYLFNMESEQWEDIKWTTTGLIECPSPRSACMMSVCNKNGSVVVYGGFSKEKLKKDKERGVVHSDMFALVYETRKNGNTEWHWKKAKQGGLKPSERVSSAMVTLNDDTAILFGGVYDLKDDDEEDDDEDGEDGPSSVFYNDLYKLDLVKYKWSKIQLTGKREIKTKTKKNAVLMKETAEQTEKVPDSATDELDDEEMAEEETSDGEELVDEIDEMVLSENKENDEKEEDPFKLEIKAQMNDSSGFETKVIQQQMNDIVLPHPRRSMFMQCHKSTVYLFGGKFEDRDEKEITLNDLYSLNLKRLEEWQCVCEDKEFKSEQLKRQMESSSDEDEDDDSDGSDMEIDAPKVEDGETLENYFERTSEVWTTEAASEFPDEKSKKFLKKMAYEMCQMFWNSVKTSQ